MEMKGYKCKTKGKCMQMTLQTNECKIKGTCFRASLGIDFGFMLDLEYADFHKTLESDRAPQKR